MNQWNLDKKEILKQMSEGLISPEAQIRKKPTFSEWLIEKEKYERNLVLNKSKKVEEVVELSEKDLEWAE